MKRARRDLVALGLAAVVTMGVYAQQEGPAAASRIDSETASAHAAFYLDAPVAAAELRGQRWRVSAGPDTAWIDASTGELVEVEFGAR